MRRAAFLALLAPAACSGEEPPKPPEDANFLRYQIFSSIRDWHKAADEGEIGKMMEMMAPDARVYSGGEQFATDPGAIEDELERRSAEIRDMKTKTIVGDEKTEFADTSGSVAVCTYVANVGTRRGIFTMVLRRTQDRWLITHVHDSWPAKAE